MTDDEIRIACAEACGWSITQNPQGRFPLADYGFTLRKNGNGITTVHGVSSSEAAWRGSVNSLPDYPNDLNACHEMEKRLGRDQALEDYESELVAAMQVGNRVCDFSQYPSDKIWHATARQRCEAFLRTIGKWKDA